MKQEPGRQQPGIPVLQGGEDVKYGKIMLDREEMMANQKRTDMGNDLINSPQHYQGKVECIDAIEAATAGLTGIEAVRTGNAIKYLYRWKKKGGRQDLEKARWYINKLLGDV